VQLKHSLQELSRREAEGDVDELAGMVLPFAGLSMDRTYLCLIEPSLLPGRKVDNLCGSCAAVFWRRSRSHNFDPSGHHSSVCPPRLEPSVLAGP